MRIAFLEDDYYGQTPGTAIMTSDAVHAFSIDMDTRNCVSTVGSIYTAMGQDAVDDLFDAARMKRKPETTTRLRGYQGCHPINTWAISAMPIGAARG